MQEAGLTMVWSRVRLAPLQGPVEYKGGGRGVGWIPHGNAMEPRVNPLGQMGSPAGAHYFQE